MDPKCPECGSKSVSVRAIVFLDYADGTPTLDPEDGEYAEPVAEPNNAICRHCERPITV